METTGTVKEIWRYPVSSLGGEMCMDVFVGDTGVEGDRQFALFDPASGKVAAPEKEARWRPALFLSSAREATGARIGFPDGAWLHVADPLILPMLSDHFGFDVAVGRYKDLDGQSAALPQIENRYNVAPIHLVTAASMKKLKTLVPDAKIDRRRFRPNILVEGKTEADFAEMGWIDETLSFGGLLCKVSEQAKRCGMTLIAQPGLDEKAEILRSIVRHASRSFGVYCDILKPGKVRVGTAFSRCSPPASPTRNDQAARS